MESPPEGALVPGLQQANVMAREALVEALRQAFSAVAGRSRDVCLVIPDATTRIMLLDFDTLPPKPQEADAVVRFRLKKSLPFEVDESAVSYDSQGTADPVRVVAAVTPRAVLQEYESLVRDAGYNPGAVLPSMIAALGAVDASLHAAQHASAASQRTTPPERPAPTTRPRSRRAACDG